MESKAPPMQQRTTSDSEDDDDDDYVPPQQEPSDNSDEEPTAKKVRTRSPTPDETPEEKERKQRAQQELFEEFKASASSGNVASEANPPKMVSIVKRYRFAGQETTEVVEVPEDSPEASQWPRSSEDTPPDLPTNAPSTSTSTSKTSQSSSSSTASRPPGGPLRKGRTKILSTSSTKVKKLSTLDKSAMDWNSHLNSEPSELKDELEANRRGGGYLEKVEFLQRVDQRKDEALAASKGTKRRR